MKPINNLITFISAITLSLAVTANTPTRGDYVSYSFAITPTETLLNADQPAMESSKSFWKEVTGKELKQGVAIQNNGASPLVLLSHHATTKAAPPIDVKQLHLEGEHGQPVASKMVSEDALRETGFFARSAAVTVADANSDEPLTLQSTQVFADDQLFVMTVKDKNSPVSLDVFAPYQRIKSGQSHLANVSLSLFSRRKLVLDKQNADVKAILHAPDGERIPLNLKKGSHEVLVMSPTLKNVLSPREGLYDIEVILNADVGGQRLQRNAKVAVAMSTKTGKLNSYSLLEDEPATASISFMAFKPGRFEVRAVLYGHNKEGRRVAIMEGHAAQDVNSGKSDIRLPFNLSKVQNKAIVGPYEIGNVRLYDQGQLALLDESNDRLNYKQSTKF
ncbi:DUF4785 domain-containing protein [Alteromonas sp. ASW11-130]|uniref:DUF4785 domain-containing protein n=1 Tax=Alteromonas sp. ASW11-130 TaxID=3015775 RepID=UPI002242ADB7|nr:DUF4785 domain-containing protein [Alteromonas sp. ASW11-130]MCW8092321.1 DUF4785 family protein [Alteromonas sp. ASW11-130]